MNTTGQREHNSVQYRKRWAGADKTKRHDARTELDWEVLGGACPSPPPLLANVMWGVICFAPQKKGRGGGWRNKRKGETQKAPYAAAKN